MLERGFALVRGADGTLRRRAALVKAGEALSLVFADGAIDAKAKGPSSRGTKKPKAGQGTLSDYCANVSMVLYIRHGSVAKV